MAAGARRAIGRLALALLALPFSALIAAGLLELAARRAEAFARDVPAADPPPYFRPLRDAAGAAIRDAQGRELLAIAPQLGVHFGRADVDRLWTTREKSPGRRRILSIGESTTFGAGYAPDVSYSRFLELRLDRRLGGDLVEVVNCGRNGFDSHDWPALASELPQLSPDLLVIYVGHNELKVPNVLDVIDRRRAVARRSRLARQLLGVPDVPFAPPPNVAVGALLTPAQRAFAVQLFVEGVAALLDAAASLRIPAIVCVPASNVADHPPRLSIVAPGADEARRVELVRTAGAASDGPLAKEDGTPALDDATASRALAEVDAALRDEAGAALLHWRRGRLLLALRRVEEGRAELRRGLELDGLPERATPDLVEPMVALARERGAIVVDVARRFEAEARFGAPGFDLCYDYCHPNLLGHFLIADELRAAIESSALVAPPDRFVAAREPGGDARAQLAAFERELGLDEAKKAVYQRNEAAGYLNQVGTQASVEPTAWPIVDEHLEAARRMDAAIARDATWLVVHALALAGRGDGDGARRALLDAEAADAKTAAFLTERIATLPGLVATLRAVGIEIVDGRFIWAERPK